MPLEANYRWGDLKATPQYHVRSQTRYRIGWLVLLAFLLSVLVHIVLIIVFDLIKVDQWIMGVKPVDRVLTFRPARVTISKSSLDEILPPAEEESKSEKDATPLVDNSLDEYELQEMLSEMEVKLTPEVAAATRIVDSETPDIPQNKIDPALEETPKAPAETIETNLSAMKERLLEASRASEFQPLLELNTDPENQSKADEILNSGTESATRGVQEEAIARGFSSLDTLLTRQGPLGDNTKPILLPTDLLFDYDKYELREEAKLSLMRLGILIQRNPDSDFVIEGHTDTRGTPDYNLRLSVLRAQAVRDWLINSLRIPADNVSAVGHGEAQPLVNPEGTIEEQALNRRVEIQIHKRKGKGEDKQKPEA